MEKGSAIGQSSAEFLPSSGNGSTFIEKDWEDPPHRRAFSESFLLEEQPSWLDELLDEPETPLVHIGVHQRSSSDSLAYTGVASLINMGVARDTLSRQVQYIDKLDRKVQALQAEASEAFAKLESLELESFFLGMYNEVLKICLEDFAQQQRVKCRERKEELKREYKRLRALTQQQEESQGSGH